MQNDLKLWKMVGNSWAVELLKTQIARERENKAALHHAYLFCGAKGVGRRTMALRFAQALNCTSPQEDGEPCFHCHTCLRLEKMQHLDLTLVQAEQEGGILHIEQIRTLLSTLALAPYEARYRMVLLLRFEEANINAANALLKNLEEPPPHVLFLLTASSEESLLPTIVSRCQTIHLKSLPAAVVSQQLEERLGVQAEAAQNLAHISGGRYGYASWLFQHPEAVTQRIEWLDDLWRLLSASLPERFAYAEKMADFRYKNPDAVVSMKKSLRNMLQVWLSFWRDVLLTAASQTTNNLSNIDRIKEIEKLSSEMNPTLALSTLHNTKNIFSQLERNVNARMALEVYLLDLPII